MHATATPLLALKEAQNCDGCHNGGRRERPLFERRCTLDCQGCHIDPAGGGARNQWGYYYTHDQMALFNFFKPIDPLKDKSRFDIHTDMRLATRKADDKDARTFPMGAEYTIRARPFIKYIHGVYTMSLLGRVKDDALRPNRDETRRFRDKYSLMVDNLPLALYGRFYKGQPMYGLRRANHSLWIRERIGLDQYAQTEAWEAGGTPTVPFIRYSQMSGDPEADPADRQVGTSVHGGMRGVTAGWHVNFSLWETKSEKAAIEMSALGLGFAWFDVIGYAERNWRDVKPSSDFLNGEFDDSPLRLHPDSTISEYNLSYAGIPGVIIGIVYEEMQLENGEGTKMNYFVDTHIIPFVQFELWFRQEQGFRTADDVLAILHTYADF